MLEIVEVQSPAGSNIVNLQEPQDVVGHATKSPIVSPVLEVLGVTVGRDIQRPCLRLGPRRMAGAT